ncbi:MAG: hypothetical protein ACW99U_21385 [Candidatus Thorarchaeota archaeon]|jgi:hypothetical protein
MRRKSIPELSVDTQVLIRRLAKVGIDETIEYKELSAEIRRDVQQEARGNLFTARHRLQVDEGMVFGAVFGVGLKRLDDTGILQTGMSDVKRIRNVSVRAGKRLSIVDPESLNDADQREHLLLLSQFGVLAHVGKERTQRKLAEKIKPGNLMPASEMLEKIRETL